MKVRMKQATRGAVDGHWNPPAGAVLEVSDPAGALLCAKGFAEPVAEPTVKRAEVRPAAKRAEIRKD